VAPLQPGDALVMATSGTTGEPKGVVLTHEAITASAAATSRHLGIDRHRHHWLACLPLAHVGGLSVVCRALWAGTALTVTDRFDADRALASGATHVSLVSTALRRLGERAAAFERIVLGGAAPPERLATNVVVTYGLTETGSGVVYDGRPLPGVEVRVLDGELQLRGPMLLRQYRHGHDPKTPDGWLPTGDAGSVDPVDGTVRVLGRRGDLIISGGQNVWPEPVEQVIAALAGVVEVAVVGRADPEWGQRVTALIVPGGTAPSLEEVRAAVKQALPAYCAPHAVEHVAALPRTALGKIQRHALSRSVGPASG
jgi:O-succinylbenzoic acid--CoA ligase